MSTNNSHLSTSIFYRDDVINIFCDASSEPVQMGQPLYNVCSGFVAVNGGKIVDEFYHIINDSTSHFGELDALRLAISYAISASRAFKRVNIFSDSQSAVFGIRNWIERWKLKNGNISGSKKISHHQVYIELALMLMESGVNNIAIYHQKGHIGTNSSGKNIIAAHNLFLSSNGLSGLKIDNTFIIYISKWNSYVDKATRKLLDSELLKEINYIEPLEFNTGNFKEIQRSVAPVLRDIRQNLYL